MLSVILPVYNEQENVGPLLEKLFAVLKDIGGTFEVIAVNDGSKDDTLSRLHAARDSYPELIVVDFLRNYGQTAAIQAGMDHASGGIIVMMDADMQNDPTDIPALLAKLDEGYDVVSGWRHDRQDAKIRRTFLSNVANWVISRISGVHLHDYGCTLKAYRSNVLEGVRLYGEMHRFIPIYAHWMGARITELPVKHHPRLHGKANYGLERIIKVILDIIVIMFLDRFLTKPIYVFGGFGVCALLICVATSVWALCLKIFFGVSFILTPLPSIAIFSALLGIMSILLGLLAEMLSRTYFEIQGRRPYAIRSIKKSE